MIGRQRQRQRRPGSETPPGILPGLRLPCVRKHYLSNAAVVYYLLSLSSIVVLTHTERSYHSAPTAAPTAQPGAGAAGAAALRIGCFNVLNKLNPFKNVHPIKNYKKWKRQKLEEKRHKLKERTGVLVFSDE
jgi:hypothetical protein